MCYLILLKNLEFHPTTFPNLVLTSYSPTLSVDLITQGRWDVPMCVLLWCVVKTFVSHRYSHFLCPLDFPTRKNKSLSALINIVFSLYGINVNLFFETCQFSWYEQYFSLIFPSVILSYCMYSNHWWTKLLKWIVIIVVLSFPLMTKLEKRDFKCL